MKRRSKILPKKVKPEATKFLQGRHAAAVRNNKENKMAKKEKNTKIRAGRNRQKEEELNTKYNLVQKAPSRQNKEVLMPRRFVAAAAELARSASLLPPLSLPT